MAERGDDIGCDQVRDDLELLAIEALGPDETARLRRHLESCPSCRAELAKIESVVAAVLLTAPRPVADPALVDRVLAARLASRAPEEDGPTPEAPLGAVPSERRSHAPGRGRLVAAAVLTAAAALLLGVAAGVLIGRSTGTDTPSALERVGVDDVRTGVFSGWSGDASGTAVVTTGERPTLLVALDGARSGMTYSCEVRLADGTTIDVGSWTPTTDGETTWAVALDPTAAAADQVVLTGPSGTQMASASLS